MKASVLSLLLTCLPWLALAGAQTSPEDGKLRIICFGAHPDDCEIQAGGVAAMWAAKGHHVKLVSVTNGDIGHWREAGGPLAQRRKTEAQKADEILGVTSEVLDIHDGELLPTIENRRTITRLIREWKADLVLGPRPNDYHPDHRYTGVLVQDAAYMVVVPNVLPDTPALRKNPVFFYYQDRFQRPNPFRPDVVVSLDEVIDKKLDALDAHVSQVYEWLPWVDGKLDQVPKDRAARREWLKHWVSSNPSPEVRRQLVKWYGEKGNSVTYYEAFELCEYGSQPDEARIRQLFPMLH